jgi:hypothetical protein
MLLFAKIGDIDMLERHPLLVEALKKLLTPEKKVVADDKSTVTDAVLEVKKQKTESDENNSSSVLGHP